MSDLEKEFIDRDHQYPADVRITPPDVANDNAAAEALARTPAGEPPDDYTVRSVYDSRPVSAYDFNITGSQVMDTGSTGLQLISFDVPSGYVCVLRGVTTFISTPPALVSDSGVTATLKLNKSDVRNNIGIPVGVRGAFNCFVIADEFVTVGIAFNFTLNSLTSRIFATFYGNFLLKTDVPSPFEIANRAGSGSIAPRGGTALETLVDAPGELLAPRSGEDSRIQRRAGSFNRPPTASEWMSMSESEKGAYNNEMARRAAVGA